MSEEKQKFTLTSFNIKEWMFELERKKIAIPVFQRPGVWKVELVKEFLDTIFQDRPVGVLFLAKVSTKHAFTYFPFKKGGPAKLDKNSCEFYILDGQQRIRALWSSFKDVHGTHSYFVKIDDAGNYEGICAIEKSKLGEESQSRDPNKDRENNRIPFYLLDPHSSSKVSNKWFKGVKDIKKWREYVDCLREKISAYPIYYFEVDCSELDREEIIEIFLGINRSAITLSQYNLALAKMEKDTQSSLYELVTEIHDEVPKIGHLEGYTDTSKQDNLIPEIDGPPMGLGELILKIEWLRQEAVKWNKARQEENAREKKVSKPTDSTMKNLTFEELINSVPEIKSGLILTADILKKRFKIKSNFMLPTTVPLRVLPALCSYLPNKNDPKYRIAEELLVYYLAFSFFTDRYQQRANDALAKDFEGLLLSIVNISNPKEFQKFQKEIPIFNEAQPFRKEQIEKASWPQRGGIISRSILLLRYLDFENPEQRKCEDIVSYIKLSKHGSSRHFHHIFPRSQLRNIGVARAKRELALNCMLLTPHSNQEWLDKWPGDFFVERIKSESDIGYEEEYKTKERLENRLEEYTLSTSSNGIAKLLLNAKGSEGNKNLSHSYDRFIDKSAKAFEAKIISILESILSKMDIDRDISQP